MTHLASLIESKSAPPPTSRNKLAVLGWRALPILILALVTYYALFRLPFRFPPRQRLMSASYAFGFNNSVAIFALAAIVASSRSCICSGRVASVSCQSSLWMNAPSRSG